jgi:hypothetical protein
MNDEFYVAQSGQTPRRLKAQGNADRAKTQRGRERVVIPDFFLDSVFIVPNSSLFWVNFMSRRGAETQRCREAEIELAMPKFFIDSALIVPK